MAHEAAPSLQELLAHTRWVERLARSLVRDPEAAADVAQSTLLAAIEHAAPKRNFRAWLAGVLRNQVRGRARRESARRGVEQHGARAEALPGADELVLRAEGERRVVAAVLALEEPHRSTLLLSYFEDLSPQEIARRSGAPLATVTSRITRAHARLREALGGEDPRGAWLGALAPILAGRAGSPHVAPDLGPASAAAASTAPTTVLGLLLMSTALKVTLALALAAGIVWLAWPERETPAIDAAAAPTETAPVVSAAAPPAAAPAPAAAEPRTPLAAPEPAPPPAPAVAPEPEAPQTGRIHGQVFRPDGRPAPQRRVRMLRGNKGEKYAVTDEDGRFDERELELGLWSISTWPGKDELAAIGKTPQETLDGFAFLDQRTLELRAGEEVELALGKPPESGVRVHGRILRAGAPVGGTVQWLASGVDAMDRQKIGPTSKEKRYEVVLDGPGRYLAIVIQGDARIERAVEVPAQPELEHDFVLPTARLEGRVTRADGAAVAGAQVALTPRAGVAPRHPISTITFQRKTDAEGRFQYQDLDPGRYALGVSGGAAGEDKGRVAARTVQNVEVREGEAEPLAIELAGDGAVVTGTVDASAVPGITIPQIYVFDASGEPLNPINAVSCAKETGAFKLFALAPGTYHAVAGRGLAWSDVATFVVPAQGDPPSLQLVLAPCAWLDVELEGREQTSLDVRHASGVSLSGLLDKHVFDRQVMRDWSTQKYEFRVPAGEYRVVARGADGMAAEQQAIARSGERIPVDLSRR